MFSYFSVCYKNLLDCFLIHVIASCTLKLFKAIATQTQKGIPRITLQNQSEHRGISPKILKGALETNVP